jgi:XTP/dITP diphosphohydrolase
LLIATSNQGKLSELRDMLSDLSFELLSLQHFPAAKQIRETGDTFVANASLKAIGYAKQTHLLTLADDSGLEVDALGGAPGVWSARYAGKLASDSERTAKLLKEMARVPTTGRSARFISAVAVASAEGQILHVSSAICEGRIASSPRGASGFGFDPIFVPSGYQLTFAQLSPDVKNQISHRALALSSACKFLRTLTATSSHR